MCIVITYFYLPETKGRSPAELDVMFAARIPARQFKGKLRDIGYHPFDRPTLHVLIPFVFLDYVCNINTESYMAEHKHHVEPVEKVA